RSVRVSCNHDPRGPVLPGQLPNLLDDEVDVRIVKLLDVLSVGVAGDLLVQVPRVGEEVDDDSLREDLVLLALDGGGGCGSEMDVVLVLLARVLLVVAQLLDTPKIRHLAPPGP